MNLFNMLAGLMLRVANFIVSKLPDADQDTVDMMSFYMTDFRSKLDSAQWFFPVNMLLVLLAMVFGIEISIFTYKNAREIVKLIRG